MDSGRLLKAGCKAVDMCGWQWSSAELCKLSKGVLRRHSSPYDAAIKMAGLLPIRQNPLGSILQAEFWTPMHASALKSSYTHLSGSDRDCLWSVVTSSLMLTAIAPILPLSSEALSSDSWICFLAKHLTFSNGTSKGVRSTCTVAWPRVTAFLRPRPCCFHPPSSSSS